VHLRANLFLLLAAAIWGFAFVAQRVGMDNLGPFTFNGIRFALGSLSLLPLILSGRFAPAPRRDSDPPRANAAKVGLCVGLVLFAGASLQQIGLVSTTAGKAAFVTSLYIVLVPLTGVFLRHRVGLAAWAGSLIAVAGLYFLCVKQGFSVEYGDLLELVGAFFWTGHILLIDRFAPRVDVLKLAACQFATCSALSLAAAFLTETATPAAVAAAGLPLLYGGICSVAIAYTLQILGQKNTSPAPAAIILSMEAVFAALGGYLILGERLGVRELAGCGLMLAGMILSQVQGLRGQKIS
jgi:drug/metabolite transporter (DMT)-like permease